MKQTDELPENWAAKARRKLAELSIEHGRVLGEHVRLVNSIHEAAQERKRLQRELEVQQRAVLYGYPNEPKMKKVQAQLTGVNDLIEHIRRMQDKFSHTPSGEVFWQAEKIAQLLRI